MSATHVRRIRDKLPTGRTLPESFENFVEARPPQAIGWSSLKDFDLKPSAGREATPFLQLGDGGVLAFWFRDDTTPVIHLDGHGGLRVVAIDFDAFLKAVNTKATGVPQLDEADPPLQIASAVSRFERQPTDTLDEDLQDWFARHTSLQPSLTGPEAQDLRQRVCAVAEAMLRDGRSKVYTLEHDWWSLDFQIEQSGRDLRLQYRDYGKWYPVPPDYGLEPLAKSLLRLVNHKDRPQYELSVVSEGIVSIDGDRELVIEPA